MHAELQPLSNSPELKTKNHKEEETCSDRTFTWPAELQPIYNWPRMKKERKSYQEVVTTLGLRSYNQFQIEWKTKKLRIDKMFWIELSIPVDGAERRPLELILKCQDVNS